MIDFEKKNKSRINLVKQVMERKLLTEKAQVCLCLDISGSMQSHFENGTVQDVLERLLPIALEFDDNGRIDVLLFSSRTDWYSSFCLENREDFAKSIYDNYKNSMGSTCYSLPIKALTKAYKSAGKKHFFRKKEDPAYIIFLTDGDCDSSNKDEAMEAIKKASHYGIFFQFVGIGNSRFDFLEHLDSMEGRYEDNANFFHVNDLANISDEELYDRLLNEFPDWLRKAKDKKIIY